MNDEIGNLTRFLEDHRAIFRRKAGGLNRDQLQQNLSPSDLTLGGMLKHLTFVEDWWFGRHICAAQSEPWASVDWKADNDWDWHSAADDTPEQLWRLWEDAVDRSRADVAAALAAGGLDGLAARSGKDGERPSLRWILFHLVEEYARHAGHADLIREAADGLVGE